MDFSCNEISTSNSTPTNFSTNKVSQVVKHSACTLRLYIAPITTEGEATTHWPLGIVVGNSFTLKRFLELNATLPGTLGILNCHTKIIYPESFKKEIKEINFSEPILEEFSFEELTRISWMGSQVITLVTHKTAENVMEAFDQLKSLHLNEVINPSEVINLNEVINEVFLFIFFFSPSFLKNKKKKLFSFFKK